MPDAVDVNVVALVSGQAPHGSGQLIDRVGHHIRQPGDQGGDQDFCHGLLLLRCSGGQSTVLVDFVDLRQVFRDGTGHLRQLQVASLNGFDRVDVVAELELFIALEEARLEGLVALQKLEHGIVGVNHAGIRDGAEQFVIGGHRVGVAIVPLVGSGGGVARDDARCGGSSSCRSETVQCGRRARERVWPIRNRSWRV